ncbi:MAG: hypothetical protein JSW21_05760 [Gammaproteobacteria bacterium]|nr:MAG: hypothetical protein JSW21_05760 [Gammaproteobacteria bacterium]
MLGARFGCGRQKADAVTQFIAHLVSGATTRVECGIAP